MMRYIVSLDQGTTSSRAILINQNGKLIDIKQKDIIMKQMIGSML